MKRLLLWFLCLALVLCTGCTALPAEERSFAVVLGVDRSAEGWTACARIPTYQSDGGYATVQGNGQTLDAALSALEAASPMQLQLGQMRMLVFTQVLAQSPDFPGALETLSGRHDVRLEAAVAVTDAPLSALMDALSPSTGSRLSKTLDVLMEMRIQQGTALPSGLADVIRMGERQSPVLMHLTLEGESIALSGGWLVNQSGLVTTLLTPQEVQLLSLMLGRMRSGSLSLPQGAVRLTSSRAETALSLMDSPQGTVKLTLRCLSMPLTAEALAEEMADECQQLLARLSSMNCDALGLARQAVVQMNTMADWHALDWPTLYSQMNWTVEVTVSGAA